MHEDRPQVAFRWDRGHPRAFGSRQADDWDGESWLTNRWLWLFLLLAWVHLYLARLPIATLDFVEAKKSVKDPVAVELFDKQRPVVTTERSRTEAQDDKKPAALTGEFQNRVEKETQAKERGRFREFRAGGKAGKGQEGRLDRSIEGRGDLETARIRALGIADLMPQSAASPNRLPDSVAAGLRTVLNTDSVLHASFFNRIGEAIYDGWVSEAQLAVERMRVQGRVLTANDYVTRIVIEIDTDGNLREVRLAQSCGVPLLDDAPKKAFWDAQPFRNPPKALFQGQPTMLIPYEFTYQWRTTGFSLGGSSR